MACCWHAHGAWCTNRRLYRAYLLKEQLRQVFAQDPAHDAIGLLERWLAWASRSQIPRRQARAHRPRAQGRDRRRRRARAVQRQGRESQHQLRLIT